MLEVIPCPDESAEQVSLDIYNAVWPHDTLTMEDVRAFKASVCDHIDYLACIDGAPAGSAVAAIFPQRANRVFTILTVLAGHRRRGAGPALYEAVCAWTARRGLTELEVAVLDNDPESLAFAQRRGFAEERREVGVVLHLADIAPLDIEPPDGVDIVTWAERPELIRGVYEVALEAGPDIPGSEDDVVRRPGHGRARSGAARRVAGACRPGAHDPGICRDRP